ncbi:MAG: hypothetical protein M0P13_04780 [Fibrobacteraceae bacterium]|nr:hypothetical protein [Fibrobacteraceae bacterium]
MLTKGLDSLWIAEAGKENLTTQTYYNKYLELVPVTKDSIFSICPDGYFINTVVSASTQIQERYSIQNNTWVSSVEYTSTMYDCQTQKVVWKLIVSESTNLDYKNQFIDAVFKDFRTNKIIQEQK